MDNAGVITYMMILHELIVINRVIVDKLHSGWFQDLNKKIFVE